MSSAIRTLLIDAVRDALVRLDIAAPEMSATINLERPARPEHGDWSTNVALATAKAAGRNPRELATAIQEALTNAKIPYVTSVEIAGPGFLNFRLADSWLHDVVATVLDQGPRYADRADIGNGRTVNVEYVSANPTGPLHAGHARWAAYATRSAGSSQRSGMSCIESSTSTTAASR